MAGFCTHCGAAYADDAQFCGTCGRPVAVTATPPTSAAPPAPTSYTEKYRQVPTPTAPPPPAQTPRRGPRPVTVAAVVAMLVVIAVGVWAFVGMGGGSGATPAGATIGAGGGGPISVSGGANGGASPSFALAGGSYSVEWGVLAPTGGCYFYLFLATHANGPTLESADGILTSGGDEHGLATWTGVPAGTYVLQEDTSGAMNCTGAWSATVTPQ